MFHQKSDKWITNFLNLLRLLGTLPFTWEYRKPDLESQTKTVGIRNVKLSCPISFLSIFCHVFLSCVYIVQINENFKFFVAIFNYNLSSTMKMAINVYGIIIVIYYLILIMFMMLKTKELLKIFMKNEIFLTCQWDTCRLTMFFTISMVCYSLNFAFSIVNFVRMGSGVLKAKTLSIIFSSSLLFSILHILLFYFCSETIGNGWKNIEFEKKEYLRDTHIQNHLTVNLEKALVDASYLNFIQKEIN